MRSNDNREVMFQVPRKRANELSDAEWVAEEASLAAGACLHHPHLGHFHLGAVIEGAETVPVRRFEGDHDGEDEGVRYELSAADAAWILETVPRDEAPPALPTEGLN